MGCGGGKAFFEVCLRDGRTRGCEDSKYRQIL